MTSEMNVATLDSFVALDILRPFMSRVEKEPDFRSTHGPTPVQFDPTVTLKFEGTVIRNGGAGALLFQAIKEGCFAISMMMPDPDDFLPTITIFGDVAEAKSFLDDLRAHHDAWLACGKGA
jgi:hypothetical protein